MTNLNELRDRAEAVQANFEREHAGLFRPDGSRFYSDQEHDERENTLRSERHQKLTGIEAEAKAERAAALEELERVENSDPVSFLSDDELQRAVLRRSFASDEVWSLSEEQLRARLRAVRAGGDRASLFAYWQVARSHQDVRDDATGRRGLPSALSEEIAAARDELAGPERRQRVEAAKARERKAEELILSVGSLKRGGSSNPARSYLNRKYARERLPSPLTSVREP